MVLVYITIQSNPTFIFLSISRSFRFQSFTPRLQVYKTTHTAAYSIIASAPYAVSILSRRQKPSKQATKMKTALSFLAAAAGFVAAQNLSGQPACAVSPLSLYSILLFQRLENLVPTRAPHHNHQQSPTRGNPTDLTNSDTLPLDGHLLRLRSPSNRPSLRLRLPRCRRRRRRRLPPLQLRQRGAHPGPERRRRPLRLL